VLLESMLDQTAVDRGPSGRYVLNASDSARPIATIHRVPDSFRVILDAGCGFDVLTDWFRARSRIGVAGTEP